MPYTKTNWVNGQEPAINANNLNKIEQGIFNATEIGESNSQNIQNVFQILNNIQIEGQITISDLLLFAHPVGSIYQSTNATSPATLFGGTWERLNDVFLLAAGNDYEAGDTGGEKEHILTINEMPGHHHHVDELDAAFVWAANAGGATTAISLGDPVSPGGIFKVPAHDTSDTGNSQPHNNMPPYLAVYTWVRTA